jgi:hypothetical protein
VADGKGEQEYRTNSVDSMKVIRRIRHCNNAALGKPKTARASKARTALLFSIV